MTFTLLAATLQLAAAGSTSGAAGLRGIVLSGVDASPLPDAVVSLCRKPDLCMRARPDSNGAFEFTRIKAGSYRLEVKALGYPPFIRQIAVAGRGTKSIGISMKAGCDLDSATAVRDLAAGRPRIVLQGGIAPVTTPWDARMQARFGFTYLELGDELRAPTACYIQYNRAVFRFLDGRFGPSWRDSVRTR